MPKSPAGAKKKIKEGDLVIIHWRDACTRGGWRDKADYKATTPIDVASVGWVLANPRTHITVMQTMSQESVSDSMTIPKPWIMRIIKLR